MTALAAPADLSLPFPRRSKLTWAVADSLAVTRRNLIGMIRRPQVLAFATIQPVLFVLLFRYVFGSSIHVPGVSYANYLMAGIFVQTVMFGAQSTAVGMAEDLHSGLVERFRSLVMARSAILIMEPRPGPELASTLELLAKIYERSDRQPEAASANERARLIWNSERHALRQRSGLVFSRATTPFASRSS